VQLGSTAFLQAQSGAHMTVSVVEGEGHMTAGGKTVAAPAGAQVTVPLDANLKASGTPSDPRPYDAALMQPLPVQLLPEPITIAPPVSAQAPGAFPSGLDPAELNGMELAQFCQYMTTHVLSQAGMSKEEYIALFQEARPYAAPYLPADLLVQWDQLLQRLSTCPWSTRVPRNHVQAHMTHIPCLRQPCFEVCHQSV
jgi:hypothetical protein